jgi:hypothetical protein
MFGDARVSLALLLYDFHYPRMSEFEFAPSFRDLPHYFERASISL